MVTKRDSDRVVSFAAGSDAQMDAAAGGLGGGFGGAVHTSGFAK